MAFTRKIAGNLEFNQNDGEIKHVKTGERLAKFASKFVVPVPLLAKSVEVPIDSTGLKEICGHQTLDPELVEQATDAYFETWGSAPSETDAVVDVELWDDTAGELIAKTTYSGDSGLKKAVGILSDLKSRVGHRIVLRVNVTTASATSGATQIFRSAVLKIIYDFT